MRDAQSRCFANFFKIIKNFRAIWKRINDLLDFNTSNLPTSNVTDLNNFPADQRPNSVSNVPVPDIGLMQHVPYNNHTFVMHDADPNEIKAVCMSAKYNSSCSRDDIATKLPHSVINIITPPLTHTCNLSFMST